MGHLRFYETFHKGQCVVKVVLKGSSGKKHIKFVIKGHIKIQNSGNFTFFTVPLLRTGCQVLKNSSPDAGIGRHLSAKTCRGGAGTGTGTGARKGGSGTCRGGAQI